MRRGARASAITDFATCKWRAKAWTFSPWMGDSSIPRLRGSASFPARRISSTVSTNLSTPLSCSNMQSVLTDCPHREKLGWLEESHLLGLGDHVQLRRREPVRQDRRRHSEAQTAEGLVPDIAPEYTVFAGGFRDSPEWGSAVVLSPWLAYSHYGDRGILAAHYDEHETLRRLPGGQRPTRHGRRMGWAIGTTSVPSRPA